MYLLCYLENCLIFVVIRIIWQHYDVHVNGLEL